MNNSTSKIDSSDSDTTHLAIAWVWVLRLRQDSVSQEDLAAWLSWYEADDRNKEAFEDMQGFWHQVDRVTEDPNPLSSELWLGDLATLNSPRTSIQNSVRSSGPRAWRRTISCFIRRGRRFVWAGAALAAGVGGLVVAPLITSPQQVHQLSAQYPAVEAAADTAMPQLVKETYLPDGSRVELAAKSSVALQFTDKQRLLEMHGGAAYFAVAHNRDRPFIVNVGELSVRAVGTAFNIRSAGDRVVVTVAEGTVDVYPVSQGGPESTRDVDGRPMGALRVNAGSEIVWAEKSSGPIVRTVDASHALAWRQGRLDYLNEPLASAIADINRYSKTPILIRDPAVGKIIFSGTVLTNAADSWVQALPSLFAIEVQTDANGNVVLASRDAIKASRSDQNR